ncbi:polysaccharide pyruvyl transferase family protein [Gordonia amicalis]|uniref:polysaccharide pyruvyl transferase family protein n=1 Tax=Gordonia amicalis TaxID=89053 RepID=UPI0015F5737C|nr:polysaccharide pyruvyl transferase family protein [Gordonia amicalis]MBA5847041.1 polysaccharide pyruvyl transferase family protein [Gordonia amicalis]
MRIVITNAVLSNAGDGAIFESIVHAIRRVNNGGRAEIVVFDGNEKNTSLLYPQFDIRQQYIVPTSNRKIVKRLTQLRRYAMLLFLAYVPLSQRVAKLVMRVASGPLSQMVKVYSEADIVISSGGTYLVDHYRFTPRVWELILAKKLSGGRLVLWTQSMGPFDSVVKRLSMRSLARRVDNAYFRDERSLRAWNRISHRSSADTDILPDSVFGLRTFAQRINEELRIDFVGEILVSVREWHQGLNGERLDFEQYSSAILECVQVVRSLNFEPVAVSTCQGVDGYSVDDSDTASQILSGQGVVILDGHYSPEALIDLIKHARFVITTRMHMAILALICQVPVFAVAYENKTIDLFRGLGLEKFVVEIEHFDDKWVRNNFPGIVQDIQSSVLASSVLSDLERRAILPARDLA